MRQLRVALERERARLFVGRERELAQFRAWLEDPRAQSGVVSIHGVAGIGKSTLLSEMLRLASGTGAIVLRLDGRACTASPSGFLEFLETQMVTSASVVAGLPGAAVSLPDLIGSSVEGGNQVVLGVDNFDDLAGLEGWLREDFAPALPDEGVLMVLASRRGVSLRWLNDAAWRGRLSQVHLTALGRAEAHDSTTILNLRAALSGLDFPPRLNDNPLASRLGFGGPELAAQLRERLRNQPPHPPLSVRDQQLLRGAFLGRDERPEAAAARLYLSRATYYRHVRRALERLAASLLLD
jgi:hypothetical protein